jgi:hypothetical protein
MKSLIKGLLLSFLLSTSGFIVNNNIYQKQVSKSIALRSSINNNSFPIKRNATIYKMVFNDNDNNSDNEFIFMQLYFYSVSTIYLFNFIINYIK